MFADTLHERRGVLFTLVAGAAQVEMPAYEFAYLEHEGINVVRAHRVTEREAMRFLNSGRVVPKTKPTSSRSRWPVSSRAAPESVHAAVWREQIVPSCRHQAPRRHTVVAVHRAADDALTKFAVVTDTRGVARFTLAQPGTWLIRSVYLRPCKGCKDADWESFWASYSFALE